jgi:hypothetical protein
MAVQSKHPAWMKNHPFLTQIGLQELNERGYINIQDTSIDRSFRECPDDEIHPLFQRGRWSQRDLATMDWEAFRPTLRLASRLLQCDTTIHYLYAILDQANYGTIDAKYRRPGSNPNWFRIPDFVSLQNELATRAALDDLAPRLTWSVMNPSEKLYFQGITHLVYLPVDPPLVGMPDVRTTSIIMANTIIDVLCRGASPASFAVKWDPGTDDESARLRCSALCAITMVHEVMHAFGLVHGNWPHRGNPTNPPEPYYVDSRIAELGDQWQNILFGGSYDSILLTDACPYGSTTSQWPGPGGSPFKHTVLKLSKRKYGHVRNWRTWYAVSMEWVRGLFTDDFWEQVERNGCAGLRIERKLGVRENYRVAYRWFKDEERVPYEFIDPPRSVLSDEDEEDYEGRGIIDRDDSPRHPSHRYKMEQMMTFLEGLGGFD